MERGKIDECIFSNKSRQGVKQCESDDSGNSDSSEKDNDLESKSDENGSIENEF